MKATINNKRTDKPLPTIELSDDDFNQIVRSAGNACIGLGHAVSGLAKGGDLVGAKELATSLNHIAKTISWNLKIAMEARTTDGD